MLIFLISSFAAGVAAAFGSTILVDKSKNKSKIPLPRELVLELHKSILNDPGWHLPDKEEGKVATWKLDGFEYSFSVDACKGGHYGAVFSGGEESVAFTERENLFIAETLLERTTRRFIDKRLKMLEANNLPD